MDTFDVGFIGIASDHHNIGPQHYSGRAGHDGGLGVDGDSQPGSNCFVTPSQQSCAAFALGQGSGHPVRRRHDGNAQTTGETGRQRDERGRRFRRGQCGRRFRRGQCGRPTDAANADGLAEAPAASLSKPTSGTSRVELTIDSLRTYELVKPIPVFVEALGERHYVAEVPDMNITTSASSLSEILIVLKDSVTQTYDRLRIRRNLEPEQARQLKMLETYIGKSKRGWLDRR